MTSCQNQSCPCLGKRNGKIIFLVWNENGDQLMPVFLLCLAWSSPSFLPMGVGMVKENNVIWELECFGLIVFFSDTWSLCTSMSKTDPTIARFTFRYWTSFCRLVWMKERLKLANFRNDIQERDLGEWSGLGLEMEGFRKECSKWREWAYVLRSPLYVYLKQWQCLFLGGQ